MSVKLLTEHYLEPLSLIGGYTGSYEATPVKMPHCWKSCVTAHVYMLQKSKIQRSIPYIEVALIKTAVIYLLKIQPCAPIQAVPEK